MIQALSLLPWLGLGRGARASEPAPSPAPHSGRWITAFAAYGDPKYAPGFDHFGYVNPAAPQGGVLRLRNPDRRSSFDKFNPWTVRGTAPAGVLIWMVEGLAMLSQDEPQTMYALLAQAMWIAPDYSSIAFRLRPEARFNNGDPVLADDVVHSFRMLTSKESGPDVQTQLSGVAGAVAVDERTVRFELRERTKDQLFIAALMPVFSRKWGAGKKFDQIVDEWPITTGPYRIAKAEMPSLIDFERDPNYWAQGLNVRRGQFNFDRVLYRMYSDQAVAREAFKAGDFDIFKEYSSLAWLRQHKGPKWDSGAIVKKSFHTSMGQGLQAYELNLRRPIFQDIRVREALGYTYDFETLNKTGIFKRANSVFNNSPFAAQGLPGPGELALLEPFRAQLPPRVFGPAFVAPSTGATPQGLRRNLLKARDLFGQAGWHLAPDGKLRNSKGEPFEFEYLAPGPGGITDWQRNLEKIGVTLKVRTVDFALYQRRLTAYDFDMVTIVENDFTLPKASDLAQIYGSKSADEQGNGNYRGVKSPAVDHLIAVMATARTIDELRDAARALDRVVMWSFYQVPDLYLDAELVSYWNKFGLPATQALYFQTDTLFSGFIEFGPWPLWTWWDKTLAVRK